LALVCVLLLLSAPARALLTLEVNPFSKTVAFSGSETGSIPYVDTDNAGIASWALPGTFIGGGREALGVIGALTVDSGTISAHELLVDSANSAMTYEFSLQAYAENQSITLTGTGTPISYAGLSLDNQALIESSVGQSLVVDYQPSTLSSIAIVQVPEPTSLALLGLGGLMVIRRRASR